MGIGFGTRPWAHVSVRMASAIFRSRSLRHIWPGRVNLTKIGAKEMPSKGGRDSGYGE